MLGPLVIAVIIVVLIPVGFLMSTAVAAAAVGSLLRDGAERANADSELLATDY